MRLSGACLRLALACVAVACATSRGATVDFESVRPGTQWGVESGQQPGDTALSEADIMMSLETFQFGPSQTAFFRAEVPDNQGRFAQAFPTQELTLDGIDVLFDFSMLRFDVDFVTLEFIDFGGTSNVSVNGAPIFILDPLSSIPSAVAPGVSASVIGGTRLAFVATGTTIDSLLIGGQELVIDNVTAIPEPATFLLLLAGAACLVLRRGALASVRSSV